MSNSTIGRVPPNSTEAEEQLLSACLLDGAEILARCVNSRITPSCFYVPANRIVFACLLDMLSAGKSIDASVLAEELRTSRQLDDVGGFPYILRISDRVPTTAGAAYFIEKVRELASLREVITACTYAIERCYAYTGGGISEAVKPTMERLLDVSTGADAEQEPDWDTLVDKGEDALTQTIQSSGITNNTISFPWPIMDRTFSPMERGQLVVVAARASIGKSSLARPILAHAAKEGHRAYYVTLEVNPERIPLQIASSIAGIGLRQVARAHPSDQRELFEALKSLKGYGVTMSRKDRSISRIEARARALHARGNLDILFIDHGGYLKEISEVTDGNKRDVIGMVTKRLKTLATELGIVVVLLWQLNRNSIQAGNREPNATDLKDSGSLEEDADKVLLIHRPDKDGITGMDQSLTSDASDTPRFFQNIIQAKGRDDGTSLLSFYFHRQTATFHPAEPKSNY
jgi:replicative DNA helicase